MIRIRRATESDSAALGRMGAGMVRLHYHFDNNRFLLPEGVEEGYGWWLGRETENPDAIVLVAEDDTSRDILGFAYATIEETDWSVLLGPHAGFHDLWVEENARRLGVGKMLVDAAIEIFQARNIPQVVLMTAIQNEAAQKLAEELGFRPTMIEMTRELPPAEKAEPTDAARR
jgi:ribosomal protein S18 acetylase RimI-like enzyme